MPGTLSKSPNDIGFSLCAYVGIGLIDKNFLF